MRARKRIFTLLFCLLTLTPFLLGARYNYSYYGEVIHSSAGMTYVTSFNATQIGVKMDSPDDFAVHNDRIYITSKSNNLIVLDVNFELIDGQNDAGDVVVDGKGTGIVPFTSFKHADPAITEVFTLNGPNGVTVSDDHIWVCDTGNSRIIKLNRNYEVVLVSGTPDDATFEELEDGSQLVYRPEKIAVDSSDRMYVVAKEVYEGIIELDSDGTFNRFTGVNPVSLTPWEILVRQFMTQEQLKQVAKYLPTTFTNVAMSPRNFLYATALPTESGDAKKSIQLINPKGIDVLTRKGYHIPMGDIEFNPSTHNYVVTYGPSTLKDIAYTEDGIYTVLDQKRCRLFTYDSEGNLLYINGESGAQADKFSAQASAIAYLGDDLLVLDKETSNIIVYRLTEFGKAVNLATHYHQNGEFDEAATVWEQILELNTNYENAYNGIGKYYLRQKEYKLAMDSFKYGHDDYYYSKAFKAYRNEIMRVAFAPLVITIFVLIVGYIVLKVYLKKKKEREDEL
ncbi:hypothetical protein LJC17_00565 [Acholeplasma sp. OttesenSCG-928-E16]|nr:hypothetical protein [Acholeplasma sp. OttesenSCG-928-E16]